MKRIPLYTMLALALATGIAEANTITETYTFAPLSGYTSEAGTSFPEFNLAQGTLNSITLNDTATATFSGGGISDRNRARYDIFLNGEFFTMFADAVGNGTADAFINSTVSNPAVLAAFVGSGNVATSVEVSNFNRTSAAISSTFGTESLTYNFTPIAVSVPEPGSLALLGTGLLGLGLVGFASRRHFAG